MPEDISAGHSTQSLPQWDLSNDFYSGPDDPQIKKDMAVSQAEICKFADTYRGKLANLSGNAMAAAIAEYEHLGKKADHPMLYAGLLLTTHMQDEAVKRLNQYCSDEAAKMAEPLTFWSQELCAINEKTLENKYRKSEALRHYKPYIDTVRRFKDHKLSETEERLLLRISPVDTHHWPDFLDEERTRLKFTIDGKTVNENQLDSFRDDPSETIRLEVMKESSKIYNPDTAFMRLAAKAMNMVIADQAIGDELRHYDTPISARNLANNIEGNVVNAMLETVQQNYNRTSHRYNKLKAQIMGTEKLEAHNVLAPPPAASQTFISWAEAKQIVLESYREFSPTMAKYAEEMFKKGYIDASPRPGKRGGAFLMPPNGNADHPFLFMNYQGKADDVRTLAHELGHAVHEWMAYKQQGSLNSGTPLTLAETASTFGEELVFEKLLKRVKSSEERKALLMGKIENELATVELQTQYAAFEQRAHEKYRKEGELGIKDFSAIWMDEVTRRAGPDFIPTESTAHGWARVPHIFSTPFYVYSYAFGESLVAAMFESWREGRIDNFDQKYIEMLKAGGTKHHKELLAPFGLDASRPDFWQKGVEVRSHHIDELANIVAQEKSAVQSLDGLEVSGQRGRYTLTSTRRPEETPDDQRNRMQSVADNLKQVLGDGVEISRNIIKIDHAEGMIQQKLTEMSRASRSASL